MPAYWNSESHSWWKTQCPLSTSLRPPPHPLSAITGLLYFTGVSADIGSPSAVDELEKCVFSDLCYLTESLYEWWYAASPYSPEQKPKYGPAVLWRLHLLVRWISKGSCLLAGVSVDAARTVYHGQIWKDCHWSKGPWNKHLLTTCSSCINHSLRSRHGLP